MTACVLRVAADLYLPFYHPLIFIITHQLLSYKNFAFHSSKEELCFDRSKGSLCERSPPVSVQHSPSAEAGAIRP